MMLPLLATAKPIESVYGGDYEKALGRLRRPREKKGENQIRRSYFPPKNAMKPMVIVS